MNGGIEVRGGMDSKHFKESVYAQYVVGCLVRKEREEFEAHLKAGCQSCELSLNWYRSLSMALQQDQAFEPPESSVKSVLNAFRLRKPETVNLVSMVAKVLFDSFAQPLMVGVRQPVLTERQVLYQAGEMQLDLKIEKTNEENEHLIIGQLIPPEGAASSINAFKVLLREGERVVQSTYSNELGEFIFHVVPRKSYDMEILLADSKKIFLTGIPSANDAGPLGNA